MRIIIADRHPVPRLGMITLLKSYSEELTILEFDTARPALAAVRAEAADLVLCGASTGADLGPTWLADLVDAARPGKVVVLASGLDRAACEHAHASGAWGHIPMTSSTELMLAAIRLVLAGGTYFPSLHPMVLGDRGLTRVAEVAEDQLLSRRQRDVLAEIELGRSNKEIAAALGISVATVKLHVQAILKALGARNRTEAALRTRDRTQA